MIMIYNLPWSLLSFLLHEDHAMCDPFLSITCGWLNLQEYNAASTVMQNPAAIQFNLSGNTITKPRLLYITERISI